MTILVTGALGFFGCHLLEALVRHGYADVVAVDREPADDISSALLSSLPSVRYAQLDVLDQTALRSFAVEHQPDIVIHAAAVTASPAQEEQDPAASLQANLGVTLSLMSAIEAIDGLHRLINISSAAVYGVGSSLSPIRESARLSPGTLYAVAKVTAEAAFSRLSALRKFDYASVRLGSLFGRFERPTKSRTRMSPLFRLAHALARKQSVVASGPSIGREYLHGDDAADAVVRLLGVKRWRYDTFNIGGDRSLAWGEVVELFTARGLPVAWSDGAALSDFAMTDVDARPALNTARLRSHIGAWPTRGFEEAIDALVAERPLCKPAAAV